MSTRNLCYVLACMLLCFQPARAQRTRHFAVGINPFAPVGTTNLPRIEVFGEYYFGKHSLALDIGLGNFASNYDTSLVNKIGYRLALTYKNYSIFQSFNKRHRGSDLYCGINLFYWRQQWTDAYYGMRKDSLTAFVDAYGVNRQSFGASLILGYQLTFARHFCFDTYLGLGYKKLDIVNTGRNFDKQQGDYSTGYDCGPFPCIGTMAEDSYSRLNVVCGIRLGYVFFRDRSPAPPGTDKHPAHAKKL